MEVVDYLAQLWELCLRVRDDVKVKRMYTYTGQHYFLYHLSRPLVFSSPLSLSLSLSLSFPLFFTLVRRLSGRRLTLLVVPYLS